MTAKTKSRAETRLLSDLESVGPATIRDFHDLGITRVEQLVGQSSALLYKRLRLATQTKHDPCVMDVFSAAVAQAENPHLSPEKKKWWFWSRRRKQRMQVCPDTPAYGRDITQAKAKARP